MLRNPRTSNNTKVFNNIPPLLMNEMNRAIDEMVVTCVHSCPEVPSADFRLALQHAIKQCAEVISWQEQSKDEFTIIYHETDLPESVKFLPLHIADQINSFQPGRTFIYTKKFLNLKDTKAATFADKKMPVEELQINPNKVKVYAPMCYGYTEKSTGTSFESIVNYFLEKMKIPAENIFIYLGPTEKIGCEYANNLELEFSELCAWFHKNEEFIQEKKINVLVFNDKRVANYFRHNIIQSAWYQSLRYQEGAKYVAKALIGGSKINKAFRKRLEDHAITHMELMLEKAAKEAAKLQMLNKSLSSSMNSNELIVTMIYNNAVHSPAASKYGINTFMVNGTIGVMIRAFFSNPSPYNAKNAIIEIHAAFKSHYVNYKYPKKVIFADSSTSALYRDFIVKQLFNLIYLTKNDSVGSEMLYQLSNLEDFPAPYEVNKPADPNDFHMIKIIKEVLGDKRLKYSEHSIRVKQDFCEDYNIPQTPENYDKLGFSRTRAQSVDSFFFKGKKIQPQQDLSPAQLKSSRERSHSLDSFFDKGYKSKSLKLTHNVKHPPRRRVIK